MMAGNKRGKNSDETFRLSRQQVSSSRMKKKEEEETRLKRDARRREVRLLRPPRRWY